MQIDMHFYGVYALARAAGIEPSTASTIAHASQFVDDATEDKDFILNGACILPCLTSHKPLDVQNVLLGNQWQVWVPFHFLPGNEGDETHFFERMTCRKDSAPAQKILEWALGKEHREYSPHVAGIVAHVYADTFSHHGFVGLSTDWNKVDNKTIHITCDDDSMKEYVLNKFERFKDKFAGAVAETVSPVGHGPVCTFPDRPYLSWRYEYEDTFNCSGRKEVRRNNLQDFHDGCAGLFAFFRKFLTVYPQYKDGTELSWDAIQAPVRTILALEKPKEGRIDAWLGAINNGTLFAPQAADINITYNEDAWRVSEINSAPLPETSNPYLFIKASHLYRKYVLNQLLPELDLIKSV